jgi:ribose transport system substrate-binding protein
MPYITMHKGAQAAAEALGVDLLFQGALKSDLERQVRVLDANSFHQVEHMVDAD